jgi:uncharacterized protein YjcR
MIMYNHIKKLVMQYDLRRCRMNDQQQYTLTLVQVAYSLGVSPNTINTWYRFKKQCPNNEYAKMLPTYEQYGARQTRYWKPEALKKFREFQNKIPKGKNGVMGCVTQKYYNKPVEVSDGKCN